MREFLEDAHKHQDDGYSRAQAHIKRALPKRFYKEATVTDVEGGFAVVLDGRTIKTPGKVTVVLPVRELAEEVASEWAQQQEFIDPGTMPLTKLVNSALEGGHAVAPALRDEIVSFASNDLLLYRADTPKELVAAQEAAWDSVLVALAKQFEVKFRPVIGIIHQAQPEQTLQKFNELLEEEEFLVLTAMTSITGLTGSGLLAIGLRSKLLDGDTAWTAAHVDEDHNIRLWGTDAEAEKRRNERRIEFDAALRVLELIA